jgi:hypothetical protein
MTEEDVRQRIADVADKFWSPHLLEEVYGIRLPDEALLGEVRRWAQRLRRPRAVEREGRLDRTILENYFQSARRIPRKWAAVQLGMSVSSLGDLLGALEDRGLLDPTVTAVTDQLVDEAFVRDVRNYVPGLQNRLFADHNVACRSLHAAIEETLKVEVAALHCVTAKADGEDPADFAYEFDIITGDPVGLRQNVWLDFGKPINLRPDVCAVLTFRRYPAAIRPYLFGKAEPGLASDAAIG